MKPFLISSLLLCLTLSLRAQVVITDPPLPLVTSPVTVIFDATQGSGGLAGYTGDVYAHTGVITEFSTSGSDWKYVMSNWGQNTPETKLTRIGQDLYSLQVTPNVRDYYGVPASEQILKMAFVFRSASQVGGQWLEGKTETGGDIFVDVYEAGLSVTFTRPAQFPVILELNETFITEVNANEADSISLFINETLIRKEAGNNLIDTIMGGNYGSFLIKAVAENTEGSVADSFNYIVRSEVVVEPLPAGIRDGINYTGPQSAVLCLFAPYKEFVYLIGDFNDWALTNDYYMKRTPDGMRYWLELNNLVPGKEYVFQYYIDGEIKVGDPYADKTSDPWNDPYISSATYPGLIPYPAGKTTGIATVLQTNQQPYDWEVDDFKPATKTDLVIYELLVRDFVSEHTFAGVLDSLDYLANLGVNVIELMPVNEFEGNSSWGYNPSFYFAPDKYYGPKNDLKHFIDECHKRGIAVFIDLVLNHAYDQCVFVQMYFDGDKPTSENPWFNVNSNFSNPDAQWGNDFNHESEYTQALVDSVNSYWMSEYKVDGFRFDFTKGFSNTPHGTNDPWGSNYDAARITLLKRMADEIWKRNPDAYVVFEHLSENSEEKVLADYGILMWGNLNYNYSEAAMGYHDNNKSNFSWISYKQRNWNEPNVVGYMESHDEERVAVKCITYGNSMGTYQIKDTATTLQRLALDAIFFLTVPGPKMIWQFGELGYDYSIDYGCRVCEKPIRWDYLQDPRRLTLMNFYKQLILFKISNSIFESETFTLTVAAPLKKIVITSDFGNLVVIGNFDVKEGSIVPGFPHTGTWWDYFSGEMIEVTDLNAAYPLQAGQFKMFNDTYLGVDENTDDSGWLKIYPNPGDVFHFEFTLQSNTEARIHVFDPTGRKVASVFDGSLGRGTHTFQWDANGAGLSQGLYLVRLDAGPQSTVSRIILN
jgi:1,4-alpha-glucan branching enzyme